MKHNNSISVGAGLRSEEERIEGDGAGFSGVTALRGVERLHRGQRLNSGRSGTVENRGGGVLMQPSQ